MLGYLFSQIQTELRIYEADGTAGWMKKGDLLKLTPKTIQEQQ